MGFESADEIRSEPNVNCTGTVRKENINNIFHVRKEKDRLNPETACLFVAGTRIELVSASGGYESDKMVSRVYIAKWC